MCGIVAIFSPERGVSVDALQAATVRLRHRGPDGRRTWVSAEGQAGLGHTQLNIVSPAGVQPIASEDGQRWIVANGEFYDFVAIRNRLEARGHRFRTQTDSEIALHLYEERGASCLEELRGEFAFVVWDGASKTLFAARDRFGIKPLFYTRLGEAWILASEVKALFAAGLDATWNHEAVYQQIFGCFRPDRSLFAGVRQVPPGHYLQIGQGSHRLTSYWDVNYPRRRRTRDFREAECVQEVRRLLAEAVTLRTQAHVPVGYLLSGGLDSSTVMSMAAAVSDRPVQAFTIAFDGTPYDESLKARAAAEHVGARLEILRVTDADVADNFAGSVWHGETIQINAHGTARFLLSREIQASGYRAVMAGEGADELFAGYDFVRSAVAKRSALRLVPRLLKMLGALNQAERRIALASPLLARICRALPQAFVSPFADASGLLHSLLSLDFVARFAGHDPYRDLFRHLDWMRQMWGRERAKQVMYVWLRSIFVNYHMAAERLDMAHAVEVRLPFLDHELFDYASQIPVSLLAGEGRQKHLLREAARPFVAEATYVGAKQPFYAPPTALRPDSRLHELVQDTVRGETMASLPFFNQKAALALLDGAPRLEPGARTVLDPLLMVIVSLCLLQEQFAL
ncbi:MAG TPA: asparagine synthase (glutamine-hydrolyzing) [Rubrobacter sp.]|nr:asparagine synthase (glutamine-hydrolyzing) [Rubrobacter sp.]